MDLEFFTRILAIVLASVPRRFMKAAISSMVLSRGSFFFLFLLSKTERTCQVLAAIRSYVITSSASRSPRFRVRIERFYYDVDLRSGSNSTDEHRTLVAGSFLVGQWNSWPESFSFFLPGLGIAPSFKLRSSAPKISLYLFGEREISVLIMWIEIKFSRSIEQS